MNDLTCCNNQKIFNSDHKKFDHDKNLTFEVTNRHCSSCRMHWYGINGEIKKYTSKEWDAWLETAFDKVRA